MGLKRKALNKACALLLRLLVALRRSITQFIRRLTGKVGDFSGDVFTKLNPSDLALRKANQMDRIEYSAPASFIDMLDYRTKKKRLSDKKLPEWELNNKARGAKLAELSGVRVPKIYQEEVRIEEINWKDNTVIKPIPGAGSQGVYCYYDEKKIWDAYHACYLSSREELLSSLATYNSAVDKDRWMVEELILREDGGLPRDIKFYAFYGEVGMVLEVNNPSEKKYCFWGVDGSLLDAGKHFRGRAFEGEGFREADLDVAKRLSLEVPAPFVRIDFLDDGSGLIFGEFTPRPGGYGLLGRQIDALLGTEFLKAENRLSSDLVEGREFRNYSHAIGK